jgi:hypothetical protein
MRFVDSTASAGTAYRYSIRALNGSGASGFSEPASTSAG